MAEATATAESEPTSAPSYLDRLPESVREQFADVMVDAPPVDSEAASDVAEDDSEFDTPIESVSTTEEFPTPTSGEEQQAPPSDEIVYTRRNARELVEAAKAKEAEAIALAEQIKAEKASVEQQATGYQQKLGLITEVASALLGELPQRETVKEALSRGDWDTLDNVAWTDTNGRQYRGFASVQDIQDYVKSLDKRELDAQAISSEYHDRFVKNTHTEYVEQSKRVGIDPKEVVGTAHAIGLPKLVDAAISHGAQQWKGKYDALKADYDALVSRTGPSTAPEQGGRSPNVGKFTAEQISRMSPQEYMKHRASILGQIPG